MNFIHRSHNLIIEYDPPFIGMKTFESGTKNLKCYPEISEEIEN